MGRVLIGKYYIRVYEIMERKIDEGDIVGNARWP